jgi:hypothetical protein
MIRSVSSRRSPLATNAPLSFTHDAMGRETRRANGVGFKLDSTYDIAGQLIRQTGGFDSASFGLGVAGAMAAQAAGFAPGGGAQIPAPARRGSASSCPRFGAQHADALAILDRKASSGQNHPAAVPDRNAPEGDCAHEAAPESALSSASS